MQVWHQKYTTHTTLLSDRPRAFSVTHRRHQDLIVDYGSTTSQRVRGMWGIIIFLQDNSPPPCGRTAGGTLPAGRGAANGAFFGRARKKNKKNQFHFYRCKTDYYVLDTFFFNFNGFLLLILIFWHHFEHFRNDHKKTESIFFWCFESKNGIKIWLKKLSDNKLSL